MKEFIDFFLMPYKQANLSDILLEFLAVFFGILSVGLSLRVNIWLYPIGIISTSIYIYITYMAFLYGEMLINLYYTLMSVYGWMMWKKNKDKNKEVKISFSKNRDYFYTVILFLFSIVLTFIIYKYNDKLKETYVWVDMFTTAVFFCAMYKMANRKIESWFFWMIGNLISIPLYFYKGLALTSFQFIIFEILSIRGYFSWKKKLEINA
jgi:nicotinamide mononucleotide transporter